MSHYVSFFGLTLCLIKQNEMNGVELCVCFRNSFVMEYMELTGDQTTQLAVASMMAFKKHNSFLLSRCNLVFKTYTGKCAVAQNLQGYKTEVRDCFYLQQEQTACQGLENVDLKKLEIRKFVYTENIVGFVHICAFLARCLLMS